MTKVIIADDQLLFLEGLRMMLQDAKDIVIIGEGRNGIEVMDLVVKEKPDVLVTDIQMPEMDGVELSKALQEYYPDIKIIGLTVYEEDYFIVDMLEAGAKGYLMKTSSREKLLEAIQVVKNNGNYFCESTTQKLLRRIAESKFRPQVKKDQTILTELEKKIVLLICEEYSSKEIATQLYLGIKTVENYRNKIFDKIGVKNMAGLVVYAIQCGLFRP